MNIKVNALLLMLFLPSLCFAQAKTIELPLTQQVGYGPFRMALAGRAANSDDDNNPWKNTYPKVSKLPKGLTDLKVGNIDSDLYQSVYQNYLSGLITKEWYEKLQKSWNWVPDTLNLSKTPLRTKVAFAYGMDADGNRKVIIDANNNLDLSDDKWLDPLEMTQANDSKKDSLAGVYGVDVLVETFREGKILPVHIPLFMMYNAQLKMFMCNFSQYATTEYKGKQIAVSSNAFTDLSYRNIEVTWMGDRIQPGEKAKGADLLGKNEYLEMEGGLYKILGVNTNRNVLILEETNQPKDQLISTQVGFKAYPFQGDEFKTRSSVSLESLKGKYVLLDFWATWCGPCLKEIPNLKELYSKIDKSKIEIIGIVGDSPSEMLSSLIDKQGITWPQIVSDEANQIKEKYGVNGYPTTFLLDANGIIIAKNLWGKALEAKMLGL